MSTFKPPFPYLNQSSRGTRANRLSMAAPMAARWVRKASMTHEEALADLVRWMDVENSYRWMAYTDDKGNRFTLCDEYSEDFLDQFYGPYRVSYAASVWWTDKSLESIKAGSTPKIEWPTTVKSNGAKGLHEWLHEWSTTYGWITFEKEEDFYKWLNTTPNALGVISTPGHVAIALPDLVNPEIKKNGTIPLQSQAGAQNFSYRRTNSWYKSNKSTIFAGIAL